MKTFSMFLVLFFSLATLANTQYYPKDFQELIAKNQLKNQDLKYALFLILSSPHTRLSEGNDLLGCENKIGKCFTHKAVGYGTARKYLYTQLHVRHDSRGEYLKEVYCNRESLTPINQHKINCEHTWPQSKFNRAFDTELQKSDLHHLYPTDIAANSTRGNFEFAEVEVNLNLKDCNASKSGASVVSGGHTYFEPPTEHKGNVARALFYFSIRYKMAISNEQQTFLRKWNEQDPVDDAEMARNNAIEKIQGNRNPFIDYPNLAQEIAKF